MCQKIDMCQKTDTNCSDALILSSLRFNFNKTSKLVSENGHQHRGFIFEISNYYNRNK